MNTLLQSDAALHLLLTGPALLASLAIKTAVLLTVAGAISLALHRASASARHLVWLLAVLGLLGLPLLTAVTPGWHLPSRAEAVHAPAATRLPPKSLQYAAPQPQTTEPAEQTQPPLWPIVLMAAWFVGVILLLGRQAWGAFAASRLTRSCLRVGGNLTPQPPSLLASREGPGMRSFRHLCAAAGVRGPVVLRQGEWVSVPMTIGWLRPVILLPADADDWPQGRREAALRHELAHIRRRDWLWHTLAALACALYWPNPLVWFAGRRLRAESERACDDAVLAAGTRPSEYAGHLLEIARRLTTGPSHPPGAAVAMAQRPQVESRLRAILTSGLDRRSLTRRRIALTLAAAALLLTPLAALRLIAQDENSPSKMRADAMRVTSESNLRQIALGVIVYAQQHNGHLPDADRWTDEITPFWATAPILPELLHDPIVPGHHPSDYAFNKALSGVDINTIKDPSHTVLLFESTVGVRNAADTGESIPTPGRHENGTVYAFADGKVHWVPDGQPQTFTSGRAAEPILPAYLLHGHPGTGSFTGRVRYADGHPAAGVHIIAGISEATDSVLAVAMGGYWIGPARFPIPLPPTSPRPTNEELRRVGGTESITKTDGSYRLEHMTDLPYNIYVWEGDPKVRGSVTQDIEGVTGQEGKAIALPDFVLTRGGFVTGTVTDARGKPVAGVTVGCMSPLRPASTPRAMFAALTDATGHYRLQVVPGASRIYIASGLWKVPPVILTVAEGETKTADFTVRP